jgi:hypothetical protein
MTQAASIQRHVPGSSPPPPPTLVAMTALTVNAMSCPKTTMNSFWFTTRPRSRVGASSAR